MLTQGSTLVFCFLEDCDLPFWVDSYSVSVSSMYCDLPFWVDSYSVSVCSMYCDLPFWVDSYSVSVSSMYCDYPQHPRKWCQTITSINHLHIRRRLGQTAAINSSLYISWFPLCLIRHMVMWPSGVHSLPIELAALADIKFSVKTIDLPNKTCHLGG